MNKWLQLTRLQTCGITVGMLLLTRWVAAGVDAVDTLILVIAGIIHHAGFFAMNEWADRDHDHGHPHKVNPVTTGEISPRTAMIIAFGLAFSSLAILLTWGGGISWNTPFLVMACTMGLNYNLRSKRYPRLSPFLLAGWAFLLSMYVVAVSGWPARALWLPVTWSVMLYLQVMEGTLKDWDHDGRDPVARQRYHGYMDVVQLVFIVSLAPVVMFEPRMILIIFFGGGACYVCLADIELAVHDRRKMLKAMGVHNIVEYWLIAAVSVVWVGAVWLLAAALLPVAVYVGLNRLGYGSAAAPGI